MYKQIVSDSYNRILLNRTEWTASVPLAWINVRNVRLNERSQAWKSTFCVIPYRILEVTCDDGKQSCVVACWGRSRDYWRVQEEILWSVARVLYLGGCGGYLVERRIWWHFDGLNHSIPYLAASAPFQVIFGFIVKFPFLAFEKSRISVVVYGTTLGMLSVTLTHADCDLNVRFTHSDFHEVSLTSVYV